MLSPFYNPPEADAYHFIPYCYFNYYPEHKPNKRHTPNMVFSKHAQTEDQMNSAEYFCKKQPKGRLSPPHSRISSKPTN